MTAGTSFHFGCIDFSGVLKNYHRPLIPVAIALAAGIMLGGKYPGHLDEALVVGSLVLVQVVYRWYRRRGAGIAPLVLVSTLGYALISPWLPVELPANHIAHFTDSHRWRIEGIVTQRVPVRYGRSRFILRVTQLTGPEGMVAVRGRIRLTVGGEPPGIDTGTRLTFTSRIRSFHNYNNPGGFDYRRYMRFQRVHGTAFVWSDDLRIDGSGTISDGSPMARYRRRAGRIIEQAADSTTASVLKALLLGDRQAISPDVRQRFNRCGVGHLLAISGLHIGIVGGLVFAFCQWNLNRWPVVLERGWGRRGAALLAIGPMVFYASLAGLAPATQRALIMVLAFMATYFIYKEGDTLNFLAIAALVMLLWTPPTLFSISFQMSFAAVFWIILGLSGSSWKPRAGLKGLKKWHNRLRALLLTTLWATLGTLPLVMTYFQEVSLVGLATNCIMVPLIGFFVLPVGLLGLMILPGSEVLAEGCLHLAGWGLSHVLEGLQVLDRFDGIALSTFVPTLPEIVCYYGVLGLMLMRHRIRAARWLVCLAAIAVIIDGAYWLHERFWHDDLRVTILDVGQGSSALLEFPGGRTMLVDGGGYPDNRLFDVGQRIIAPFLRYRKILQVDVVALSHPSSDHMNGLVYILSHFHPQRLLWTGDQAPTDSFNIFKQTVAASGVQISDFTKIDRRMTIGGVNLTVLHPDDTTMRPNGQISGGDYNNRSIVIKVAMGACGILFPGDIEARAEERLIACCRQDLASQVLVAPHHGSRTSSSTAFLEAVHPNRVVISAGWRNRFGFPHASVLERYRILGSRIYRTDDQGAVMFRTDGRQWHATTLLPP